MVAIFISQQGECYLRYQGLPIVIIWHGGMGYGNYCHRVRFGQTQGPRFGENPKGHTLMVKMLRKIVYIIIRKACMLYQALTVYLNIVGRGGPHLTNHHRRGGHPYLAGIKPTIMPRVMISEWFPLSFKPIIAHGWYIFKRSPNNANIWEN